MAQNQAKGLGIIAIVTIPALVIGCLCGFILFFGGAGAANAACGGAAGTANPESVPEGEVGGYSGEQLRNAAFIVNAGAALDLDARAQTIGVMTAMGESSLTVVDYGDTAGPDSRGLFQQRANGAWGSYSDRMDPTISATNFFNALKGVEGWDSLEPTIAAHYVQRNADPYHYEKFWTPATAVVAALTGADAVGVGCATGEWVSPLALDTPGLLITDFYGDRPAYVIGYAYKHNGVDLGTKEGTPIHAAASGTVITTVTDKGASKAGLGNLIIIDHGDGILSRYHHIKTGGVSVTVGQQVTVEEVIGETGNSGRSNGPHLHFTIFTDGKPVTEHAVDPIAFLRDRGVDLCTIPVWERHSVESTC
ncbi:M23 family metallopeptidase [Mycetocola zhujimingii]|uniref:M23 family metallopeptidase n=1 Tax=Mycetocola zhujimingii TaxID=2079792 RepID=UPI000D3985E2|nr:M23 family metallopeptidase [Mycetocola zhujimingii]AWB88135.1 M23 family peptidase [Mycetocola zhujimingii]